MYHVPLPYLLNFRVSSLPFFSKALLSFSVFPSLSFVEWQVLWRAEIVRETYMKRSLTQERKKKVAKSIFQVIPQYILLVYVLCSVSKTYCSLFNSLNYHNFLKDFSFNRTLNFRFSSQKVDKSFTFSTLIANLLLLITYS